MFLTFDVSATEALSSVDQPIVDRIIDEVARDRRKQSNPRGHKSNNSTRG